MNLRTSFALVAVLLFTTRAWTAPQYVVVDLTPPGFSGALDGISPDGSAQIGNATDKTQHSHALLFHGSAGSVVDLNPAGFADDSVLGNDAAHQVGTGHMIGVSTPHALYWSGTAASVVDLHPTGWINSTATAVTGGQITGYGATPITPGNPTRQHALLWTAPSAASSVDLNPAGFRQSAALDTDGVHQVGSGSSDAFTGSHALLWSGTAASAVDLHPAGYAGSEAFGVSGNQQVGVANPTVGSLEHAMLWTGTAASAVDLNPVGFSTSRALATNGALQVGFGYGPATGGDAAQITHALLWSGSAGSFIDLQSYVTGYTSTLATDIDAAGNIVGRGIDSAGVSHLLMWVAPSTTAVPLPSAWPAMGALCAVVGIMSRGRCRSL